MQKLKIVNMIRQDKAVLYIKTDNPDANLYLFYAFADGHLQCFTWRENEISILYHAEENYAVMQGEEMHKELHLKDESMLLNVVLTYRE